MSSNKDKVMKTLIEENLKLRNRIVQLERESWKSCNRNTWTYCMSCWNASYRFVRF